MKKEYVDSGVDVYDIMVKDVHHYILNNGVISHNSGPFYNSSVILMLSKAQYKEGEVKTGIVVTSKIDKSRFTKAGVPIKFLISFYKGMNEFFGLENYIDYDLCGVGYGKLDKSGNYTPEEVIIKDKKNKLPLSIAVKHMNKHIQTKRLYTSEVLTLEVLEKLDEKIKTIFELPNIDSNYDVEELMGIKDEDNDGDE